MTNPNGVPLLGQDKPTPVQVVAQFAQVLANGLDIPSLLAHVSAGIVADRKAGKPIGEARIETVDMLGAMGRAQLEVRGIMLRQQQRKAHDEQPADAVLPQPDTADRPPVRLVEQDAAPAGGEAADGGASP